MTASRPPNAGWLFQHSYTALPAVFHARVDPTPVTAPDLTILNHDLATSLGLDPEQLNTPAGAAWFAGHTVPPGAQPIAQAYAGHQFGHFTMLGDGRAIVLGEQHHPAGGVVDIQLKGSGPTPFSRRGDGRAALGPMLREYLISEAMHQLGIPSTRSLAVATTGETVYRDTPLPGAVLTRVAASHLRVGTFQYAAAHRDPQLLDPLIAYTLERHFPDAPDDQPPARNLLDAVIEAQARLIAAWMQVGFIHGVMNTDNMALSGETIDYGPCAFMDTYAPDTVFSSIDQRGRYAYANQPAIAQWNLARFAETLLPALAETEDEAVALAEQALHHFADRYQHHWLNGMRRKLGLATEEPSDAELIDSLLTRMQDDHADFTNTFLQLINAVDPVDEIRETTGDPAATPLGADWHATWQARLAREARSSDDIRQQMRAANPAVIPRNHAVEAALTAAGENDLQPFHQLLEALRHPYEHDQPRPAELRSPASPAFNQTYRTFCGT
jgi:serine/tyrosine/threonine adenylyltransferase